MAFCLCLVDEPYYACYISSIKVHLRVFHAPTKGFNFGQAFYLVIQGTLQQNPEGLSAQYLPSCNQIVEAIRRIGGNAIASISQLNLPEGK